MKPIETGCRREEQNEKGIGSGLIPSDGMFLRKIAEMEEPIDLVTPVCFENPLAPLAAAQLEDKDVDLEKIKGAFLRLAEHFDTVIVEGIGGLLVPIKRDYFVLDLAKAMGLPLIVVAKPGLGTINHTLLTINCALKEGLPLAGIIINRAHLGPKDLAEETNPGVIKHISPVPLIGIFPYLDSLDATFLDKAVVEYLDLEIIKRYI